MAITRASSPRLNTPTVANMTEPSTQRARMLRIVCDTSVPSTTGKRSRIRPSRRDTISAREGSPRRAGRVADIRTPTIVARAVSRRRTRTPGRAARRIAFQASARTSIERHISMNATSTQTGVAASSARPIDSMPSRSSARSVSPAPAAAPATMTALRASRAVLRRPSAASSGSSDGSRSGPTRGPGSAGVMPARSSTRAMPVSRRGTATACS